jgi:hypothetical protein
MTTVGVRLGLYNYPPGENHQVEFRYKCESRKCAVYLLFEQPHRSIQEINRAMQFALSQNATGVTITRTKANPEVSQPAIKLDFHVCQFKPYHPRFNSDVEPIIRYEDLVLHSSRVLTANIQVVTFENKLFAYKFMSEESE